MIFNNDADFSIDCVDADAAAWCLLREADMTRLKRPSMIQLAHRLGKCFAFDVPLNAHTYLEKDKIIHLTKTSDLAELQCQSGHELGHSACIAHGIPQRRQEPHAERIRVSLQMPEFGVRSLARAHGFIPQMFIQFYRNACPPTDAIHRAAYLSGTPIIMHSNVRGRVVITETREGPCEIELSSREERKLLQRVKESGRWELGPFGVIAYPWKLGMLKGVAITFDLRRSLSRVVFGYAAE
jgi:hypothetical protein